MTDRNDNDLQLHAVLTAIYATLPADLSLNSDKLNCQGPKMVMSQISAQTEF